MRAREQSSIFVRSKCAGTTGGAPRRETRSAYVHTRGAAAGVRVGAGAECVLGRHRKDSARRGLSSATAADRRHSHVRGNSF